MPMPKKKVLKDDKDCDDDDEDEEDRFSDDYDVNHQVWNNDVNPDLYYRKKHK